jgi:AraC-like DNA-binding protein
MARLAYAKARQAGVELGPALKKAGLTDHQIETKDLRISALKQVKFVNYVAAALSDDFFGFHLAREFELREMGLLYYVMASSEILTDALLRGTRYSRIANESISLRFIEQGGFTVAFSYVGVARHLDRHQIECWMTALVRTCQQLTNRRVLPSSVKLIHRRTEDCSEINAFMGCEIEFGADADEVTFPSSIATIPTVGADPFLNELLVSYCEEALAHRTSQRGELRSVIENAMVPILPYDRMRTGEIARKLGMSERTLARRLSNEGLTFSAILDELRRDLALRYLKDDALSISQIAWLLGYQEVSAFTHAFKRWTGMTPMQVRNRTSSVDTVADNLAFTEVPPRTQ